MAGLAIAHQQRHCASMLLKQDGRLVKLANDAHAANRQSQWWKTAAPALRRTGLPVPIQLTQHQAAFKLQKTTSSYLKRALDAVAVSVAHDESEETLRKRSIKAQTALGPPTPSPLGAAAQPGAATLTEATTEVALPGGQIQDFAEALSKNEGTMQTPRLKCERHVESPRSDNFAPASDKPPTKRVSALDLAPNWPQQPYHGMNRLNLPAGSAGYHPAPWVSSTPKGPVTEGRTRQSSGIHNFYIAPIPRDMDELMTGKAMQFVPSVEKFRLLKEFNSSGFGAPSTKLARPEMKPHPQPPYRRRPPAYGQPSTPRNRMIAPPRLTPDGAPEWAYLVRVEAIRSSLAQRQAPAHRKPPERFNSNQRRRAPPRFSPRPGSAPAQS